MLSVLRLTVVLCKEISLLSKKFTSCLTAAGVSFKILSICFNVRASLIPDACKAFAPPHLDFHIYYVNLKS